METRPISFRPVPEVAKAIAEEILRSGNTIDTTEAITRLLLRGAGRPEPIYVVSGTSRLAEIEALRVAVLQVLRRLDQVKSRLGGPLNPASFEDPTRRKNIEVWRELSETLPQELRQLVDRINRTASLLLHGLTKEEFEALLSFRSFCQKLAARCATAEVALNQKFELAMQVLDKVLVPKTP